MNVGCPECGTVFRVDPAKVPAGGVQARCSICSGIIAVPDAAAARQPEASRPTTPPRPAETPYSTPPAPTPARPYAPPAAAHPTPVPAPAPFAPAPVAPAAPSIATPAAAAFTVRTTPAAPTAPTDSGEAPPAADQGTAPPAPAAAKPEAAEGAGSQRRPINPFLARDPNLRARRLARALISDMVAYYPAKHAEGLKEGTLKQLFRDEIKKSYEEYVAQVGADLAESTTHFQESLNEVLGAGKKIF